MPGKSNQKRKRQVSEGVLRGLEHYRERELSPVSDKLLNALQDMANSGDTDDVYLNTVYSYFVAMETECQSLKEENAEIRSQYQQVTQEKNDLETLLEIGDWASVCIKRIKRHEKSVKEDEKAILVEDYNEQNEIRLEEAEFVGHAESLANNEQFQEARPYGEVDAGTEAKADIDWIATGNRLVHVIDKKVKGETEAINDWREDGEDLVSLPPTPFLDRLDRMCDKAGISRSAYLQWVDAYSKRNKKAHRSIPTLLDFVKEIEQNGELVKVDIDMTNPHESIDWARFKAAIEVRKQEVEQRYAQGKISLSWRTRTIEVIDEYWRPFSEADDADGIPIPSPYAKRQASELAGKIPKSPRKTARRVTKRPNFDDIAMPENV